MEVRIGIPVRDEAQGLPGLLRSLSQQCDRDTYRTSVYLYFDGCTDGGVEIAQKFFATGDLCGSCVVAVRGSLPNAGIARRAALRMALEQTCDADTFLLTTDADSVPAHDWVACAVSELRAVNVVAGYTQRDAAVSIHARDQLEHYLERLHTLRRLIDPIDYDPAPSHPWVGGANLGMRRSAYVALGGIKPIPFGEDSDFVDRARHAGLRVRHSRKMRVITSSRTVGRAKHGLADALRHMQQEGAEPRVEQPEDAAKQYARHAYARRLFERDHATVDWEATSRLLRFPAQRLYDIARMAPNAEAFVMKAVPVSKTERDLPLSKASDALDRLTPCQFYA